MSVYTASLDPNFTKNNSKWVELYISTDADSNNVLLWDQLVTETQLLLHKYPTPNQQIKDVIENVFEKLLGHFPLFFGYWKKYVAIKYQIYGLDASIATLSHAVNVFPHSIELWLDYLNVLIANKKDAELICTSFKIAADNIGAHFQSHPFWDLYLSWCEVAEKFQVYTRVIQIPLYHYSKYYQEFTAFRNQYKLKDQLIFGQLNEMSAEEVTNHYDAFFNATQNLVSQVWPFESQIKQAYFNVTLDQIELDNWIAYLDFMISISSPFVKTLFERSLIPGLFVERLWLKYVEWSHGDVSIYKRAITSLPFDCTVLRYQYLDVVSEDEKKAILMQYMKIYPNDTKPLSKLLELVPSEMVLNAYFKKTGDRELLDIAGMLNEKTIQPAVVRYLKESTDFMTVFHEYKALMSSCDEFYILYYSYCKKNNMMTELVQFVRGLYSKIHLSPSATNDILMDFRSWYIANSSPETFDYSFLRGLLTKRPHRDTKQLMKESGHPGVSRDKPIVTNSIVDKLVTEMPPLPTFRNVERVSQPVQYINEA